MIARLDNALGSRSLNSVLSMRDMAIAGADVEEDALPKSKPPKLALVGASPLLQQCLSRAVLGRLKFEFSAFASVEDWLHADDVPSFALIILFASGERQGRDIAAVAQVLDLMGEHPHFAVLADSEQAGDVMAAFECGARAYIPTSVTVEVMIEAINLIMAGGAYCPTSVLQARAVQNVVGRGSARQAPCDLLTPREIAVLKAVRRGRSNKIIAHELGISESTIKVHVHRIMKKLKVQNRTQAAICAFPDPRD